MSQAYKKSGVNIEAGYDLVNRIKPLSKNTSRSGVIGQIGGFGALFDLKEAGYKNPILVSSTDGVGTKLKLAIELNCHDTIGQDLVAMCVNDIVVQGAEPLFFLDYFATGKLKLEVAEKVIASIARACKEANTALIGGETAEMPGMYQEGDYDLAGFVVGAADRKDLLPKKKIKEGDVLIGLASSGPHSNGYSLIRKIVKDNNIDLHSKFEEGKTLGEILLTPTKLYVKQALRLHKEGLVKGFAHITGGGFIENIPRILPDSIGAKIMLNKLPNLKIFNFLKDQGKLTQDDMFNTFNCGIGMVAIVSKKKLDKAIALLNELEEKHFIIGELITIKPDVQKVIFK